MSAPSTSLGKSQSDHAGDHCTPDVPAVREVEVPLPEGVACERTYQVVLDGGPQPLVCRWFVPEPHPEGDWECRMEISWPDGRVRKMRSGGVDSAQSLVLAFQLVAAELVVSELPVYWFDKDDALALPHLDVLAGDVAARKARFDAK